MSPTIRRAAAVVACAAMLTSCAAWEQQNRTTKGAVYGAGAGAAAGSAIGAIAGGGSGAWKGAAVGAVVGAIGGGLMGNYMDKQAAEMQGVVGPRVIRNGRPMQRRRTPATPPFCPATVGASAATCQERPGSASRAITSAPS